MYIKIPLHKQDIHTISAFPLPFFCLLLKEEPDFDSFQLVQFCNACRDGVAALDADVVFSAGEQSSHQNHVK
jgi:hypothetical protein